MTHVLLQRGRFGPEGHREGRQREDTEGEDSHLQPQEPTLAFVIKPPGCGLAQTAFSY